MNRILSPSVLSADFSHLGEDIRRVSEAGAGYIHLDIMDGSYVPNITFGPAVVASNRKMTDKVFDVHLMIDEPARFVDEFRKAGADIITFHYEATKHQDRTIQAIRASGAAAGIALNPGTPVSVLEDLLPSLDMVLLMTVNPGFGGQKFLPYSYGRIRKLREMAEQMNPSLDIEIDGGVTTENAPELLRAGANILVAGSAVFHGDAAENVRKFIHIFNEV